MRLSRYLTRDGRHLQRRLDALAGHRGCDMGRVLMAGIGVLVALSVGAAVGLAAHRLVVLSVWGQ